MNSTLPTEFRIGGISRSHNTESLEILSGGSQVAPIEGDYISRQKEKTMWIQAQDGTLYNTQHLFNIRLDGPFSDEWYITASSTTTNGAEIRLAEFKDEADATAAFERLVQRLDLSISFTS